MIEQTSAALEQCRAEADRYRLLAEQSTDMISRHSATPVITSYSIHYTKLYD